VDPSTNNSILKWYNNLIEKGCICDQRKGHWGLPSVSEQVVDRVTEAFLRSPKKSTRRASREPHVPQGTVNKITPYILQRVWSELDYPIDVCRVAGGAHIECMWYQPIPHETLWVDATVATKV
jgi:hypothetical protein